MVLLTKTGIIAEDNVSAVTHHEYTLCQHKL